MEKGHGYQGFSYNPELLYREGRVKEQLPRWSLWLIEVGKWLAAERHPGKVARVVISVPSRAYAALFAAMGVVSGSYRSGMLSEEERVGMLSHLRPGDPVRYCKGSEDNSASFGRFKKVAKEPLFEELGEFVYFHEGYARQVSRLRYIDWVPHAESFTKERTVCRSPAFVKAATGLDPFSQGFFSRLECLLIGNRRALEDDLEIGFEAAGERGKARDLLRVLEQSPRDGYRSRVVSDKSDSRSVVLGNPYGGVVLDGPKAVLRWKGKVRKHPWLAVIDRTAPTAGAAKDEIMGGLASSLEDAYPPVGPPPAGIEALYYWDRKR